MPKVLSSAEELAVLIGEAVQADVECWEASQGKAPTVARLEITYKGRAFRLLINCMPEDEESTSAN